MVCFRRGRQCTMTGLLLRVEARDPTQGKTLAPQCLLETTAVGEKRADQSRQAVLLRLPRSGVAQAAKRPSRSDPAEGLARVPLLLAAVVVLLALRSGWTVERSCSAIRPQGGERDTRRPCGGEPHGHIIGLASWEPLLRRAGMPPHRLEERKPLMSLRLGDPQAWSWSLVDGGLCHIGPQEQPFIRHRRSGTGVIRTVTPGWAGWPIAGAVLPLGRQRVLARRPQRRDFGRGYPRSSPVSSRPVGSHPRRWA
jgi:hypothetical protein